MPDSKYTAFHVPRSSPVLKKARKLAEQLTEESSIAGVRVPMYAAIDVALSEALAKRLGVDPDKVLAEALTRRMTDDQSTEVNR